MAAASHAAFQKLDTLKTQATTLMARARARAQGLRVQSSKAQLTSHPPAAPEAGSAFDLDDLIGRVDLFQRQQELQVLASLEDENHVLRRELAHLYQRYTLTCNLLREARGMLHGLERAIRAFQNRRLQAQAERPES